MMMMMTYLLTYPLPGRSNYCTLSDITGRADRNDDVVEGGSVGRRVIGVIALTLFDHVALVACLLTRLHVQVSFIGDVALVVVLWRPALSASSSTSSSSSASVTALR